MHPRRFAWLLAVFVLGGCRAEPRSASAPGDADARDPGPEGGGAHASPRVGAEAEGPPDCSPHGRVWEGRLQGCLYEHGGCCFDTPEAACTAAGCPGKTCRILESSPAQLYCIEASSVSDG